MRHLAFPFALLFSFSLSADPPKVEKRVDRKDRKHYRKAQEYFFFEEYDRAVPLLRKLVEQYPSNATIYYEMGVCMYYSPTEKTRSLPWFEKALTIAGDKADEELLYYSATAYQMMNRFDDAIRCYTGMKKYADSPEMLKSIDRLIETCENGKKFMSKPVNVRVENLGDNVNSAYPDYAPVFTGDEKLLLFTSKRKGSTGGNIADDGYYFEDVYMSKNVGESGGWSNAGKLDTTYRMLRKGPFRFLFSKAENVSEINTHDHDGSIAIAPDGKKLYIFRYSDMWQAALGDGEKWSRPKRLHESIDGKSSHEPSLCISPDGKSLYFVSDRPKGLGGKDIYRCEKMGEDTWGTPMNLGPAVNTPYDEESPYISADGSTLYFSSEGHNSMGGFDVFKSVNENGLWTKPENLGYPINNGGDDIFYVPGKNTDYGYYASMQNNTLGDLDIYAVEYLRETHRLWVRILENTGNKPVDNAKVWFTNLQNGRKNLLGISTDGEALLNFEPGATYSIVVERDGYSPAKSEISFPAGPGLDNCYQEIRFSQTKNGASLTGQEIVLFSLLFDVDKEIGEKPVGERATARVLFLEGLDKKNPRPGLQVNKVAEVYTDPVNDPAANSMVFNTIYFEFEKSELNEESRVELNRAAEYMKNNPALRFEVLGYTDNKGSESFNQELSQKRSAAAVQYLISKGISAERLRAVPKGKSDPVNGNDNEENRRKNRRVEIRVLKQ
ncbi:MAG: ompA [Bacteroidetes bacterium]|nr:MAG: ompA [Bacteroidota bacterium]